jgi:DNA invertase Pin-like site-specific DNA recombinase
MHKHVILCTVVQSSPTITSSEPAEHLRQAVEDRGDTVVGSFVDFGPEIRLRPRSVGWKNILESLYGVDQVVVMSAGDLPGKSMRDLLHLLGILRDHGVGLFVLTKHIDTGNGSSVMLDLITAYRAAQLSQAIRKGQAKALEAGKVIGRPKVPANIRLRIQACLAMGHGIRSTARHFHVSPASVINIRRSMDQINAEAA